MAIFIPPFVDAVFSLCQVLLFWPMAAERERTEQDCREDEDWGGQSVYAVFYLTSGTKGEFKERMGGGGGW